MSKASFYGRLPFLWMAGVAILLIALAGAQLLFDSRWVSIGLRDPRIAYVVGEGWLITDDGRLYHYSPGNPGLSYFDKGKSYQVQLSFDGPLVAWGPAGDDDLVVANPDGEVAVAIAGDPPRVSRLGKPPLDQSIRSVGRIQIGEFAAGTSHLAWYSYSVKAWQLLPGEFSLEHDVLASAGRLVFLSQGELGYLVFDLPDSYDPASLRYGQGVITVPGNPEIVDFDAAGRFLWLRTSEGRVLAISFPTTSEDGQFLAQSVAQLQLEAERPSLGDFQLLPGSLGFMFGPSDELFRDLWVVGEEAAYALDPETAAWERFKIPGSGEVRSVGSLWTSSETVGDHIDRLGLSSTGKVYRQIDRPGERTVWLFIIGVPATAMLSLVLTIGFAVTGSRRRRASGQAVPDP